MLEVTQTMIGMEMDAMMHDPDVTAGCSVEVETVVGRASSV